MNQIKKILQVILPLLLAVFLFWLVYKDWDFRSLANVFKSGTNYEWFLISLLVSILSMILRGLRWHQLLEPVCPETQKKNAILGIFIAYAANLLLPRAGEVARCGILKKADGVSFTKSLGTVITERAVDVIILLFITLITVLIQVDVFSAFFSKNPDSLLKLQQLATSPLLWGSMIGVILLVAILWKPLSRRPFFQKIQAIVIQLWIGMKSIMTLKSPVLFFLYSFGIWACYFINFYIVMFFFDWNLDLGVPAMLSGFVMGSFGVVAPVQGGLGAYHFMVIYTLVFYGVSEVDAGAFALVAHGLQTIYTLITGLIAYLMFLWMSKKKPKLAS